MAFEWHSLVQKYHGGVSGVTQIVDYLPTVLTTPQRLIPESKHVFDSFRFLETPLKMTNLLLKSVCNAMKRIAPPRLAEKWDNVRLAYT